MASRSEATCNSDACAKGTRWLQDLNDNGGLHFVEVKMVESFSGATKAKTEYCTGCPPGEAHPQPETKPQH